MDSYHRYFNSSINAGINAGILFLSFLFAILIHMARRKLEDRNIRKLGKSSGGSITVTIPIEMVRELKWRSGQKVVIKKQGERITIDDWQK